MSIRALSSHPQATCTSTTCTCSTTPSTDLVRGPQGEPQAPPQHGPFGHLAIRSQWQGSPRTRRATGRGPKEQERLPKKREWQGQRQELRRGGKLKCFTCCVCDALEDGTEGDTIEDCVTHSALDMDRSDPQSSKSPARLQATWGALTCVARFSNHCGKG